MVDSVHVAQTRAREVTSDRETKDYSRCGGDDTYEEAHCRFRSTGNVESYALSMHRVSLRRYVDSAWRGRRFRRHHSPNCACALHLSLDSENHLRSRFERLPN